MLHFWTDSKMVYVEKRRSNTSQIASSACLRSSRSLGHHYVNVLRKNKVAKSGKKKTVICKQKSDIWVFEMEVVMEGEAGGEEKAEKCA